LPGQLLAVPVLLQPACAALVCHAAVGARQGFFARGLAGGVALRECHLRRADARTRGAGVVAAAAVGPRAGAARPRAHRHAHRLRAVAAAVVQIAHAQRACAQAVEPALVGALARADHPALQRGVALHLDLEAAISGFDAALFPHAQVVSLHAAARKGGAATEAAAKPHAHVRTDALLLAVEAGAVLQASDLQIPAHIGLHLRCADHRATQRGVGPALQTDLLACADVRVLIALRAAVLQPLAQAAAGCDRQE
jgi:hypothetical protein